MVFASWTDMFIDTNMLLLDSIFPTNETTFDKFVYLCSTTYRGHEPRIKFVDQIKNLLQRPYFNIDTKNKEGKTLLHLFINIQGIVELLIESGADVNARDMYGKTPLFYNKYRNDYLLKNGADVNIKDWRIIVFFSMHVSIIIIVILKSL